MCRCSEKKNKDSNLEAGDAGHSLRFFFLDFFYAFYRFIRPILGPRGCCRFKPTCSRYAYEAIRKYGFAKGGFLAFKRICRCRPFGGHGNDPVP